MERTDGKREKAGAFWDTISTPRRGRSSGSGFLRVGRGTTVLPALSRFAVPATQVLAAM